MKRFTTISIFFLALLVSGSIAYAETPDEYCKANTETPEEYYACLESRSGIQPESPTQPDPAAAKTPTSDTSASMMGALDKGVAWVLNLVAKLFAWLLGVSIILLDNVVYWTVVKMGAYVNDLAAVGVTWSILRDIGNIILIFGFLAIGISTILNTERFGWKTKMLPMMLISAIFLNFSLFFAEAIVDTGNLFATQFYTQINGGQPATAREFSLSNISNDGISNKIMAQLGLQSIYGAALQNDEVLKEGTSTVIAFMSILLFITAAFVMFALSFILLARFVILLFLIITAPVGFAGLAIPQLSGIAQKWWHTLFNQTLVAPVLLLLLYIALTVITDANFLAFGKPPQWLGLVAAKGNIDIAGFGAAILAFLIAMGLLLAVIIAATKMSAFGAGWATGLAGKLSFGATGLALRSTAGWGFQNASQKFRRSRFGQTKLGRATLGAVLDKGATASFDVRGATLFGGLKAAGINAGKAQEGGYRKRREEGIKGYTEYAKSIKEAYEERGKTKSQDQAITQTKEAEEKAKEAQAQQKQKVIQLEQAVEEKRRRNQYISPQERKELEDAKQALSTLDEAYKTAVKASADAKAAPKAEIRKAQENYADSFTIIGRAMYGKGVEIAAKKIKKAARTDEEEEFRNKLKKTMEKLEKEAEGGKDKKGGEDKPKEEKTEEKKEDH